MVDLFLKFILFAVGTLFGVAVMCIMQASGKADEQMQEYLDQKYREKYQKKQ